MIASSEHLRLSPEAYLEWEAQQPIKYEYLHGEAYAMIGGTLAHNAIALNLATALKTALRGSGCRTFMADAKVGVTSQGPFFYPDVLVTYNDTDRTAKTLVQHPCLIIEVLSPGTEGYDRGEKFRQYRHLDSLQEYVLADAERMGVEIYRLNDAQKWELTPYFPDANGQAKSLIVDFFSIDFHCAIAAIYEDIDFSEALNPS